MGHSSRESSGKETGNYEGSSSSEARSYSQRKGKKHNLSKFHDPEDFKKAKPPYFKGEIKKGEEVEAWLLSLNN
jgi:hypothetical protein